MMMMKKPKNKMRIQRFIALNSNYSRRKAEELIKDGKVTINKSPAAIGASINPSKDDVFVNGDLILAQKERITIMLNKPAGYISTKKDTHERQIVMDLIPYDDLFPIGRLDKDTEGLLLLTNDGDLAYKLTHPKFEHEKEYSVLFSQKLNKKDVDRLEKGILIDGEKTAPCKIVIKKEKELHIILHEGRKRQIKRMFEEIGNKVIYLKRLRIGKLKLGNLKTGSYKLIKESDIC